MFDYVAYKPEEPLACTNCGEEIGDAGSEPSAYQTKDGEQTLATYSPEALALLNDGTARFYELCDNCNTMNYFEAQVYLTIRRITPDSEKTTDTEGTESTEDTEKV